MASDHCDLCELCGSALHHCHGLLIEHADGTAECADGCGGPRAVHDDAAPCTDLALGCCVPLPSGAPSAPVLEWAA